MTPSTVKGVAHNPRTQTPRTRGDGHGINTVLPDTVLDEEMEFTRTYDRTLSASEVKTLHDLS